jgi:uncharacterized BrkB/YihY/UPF0761 family membrane protein
MFGQDWDGGMTFGFIVALLLAIWAIIHIVQSVRTGPFGKALWSIVVLFLPYAGFIAWFFFGPRAEPKRLG